MYQVQFQKRVIGFARRFQRYSDVYKLLHCRFINRVKLHKIKAFIMVELPHTDTTIFTLNF